MKASYNWIQSYIAEELPSPEEIAQKLTLTSYEVETITKTDHDTFFDIDILPNRSSDSLGHIGIAREVALLLGTTLAVPFIKNTLDNEGRLDTNEGALTLQADPTIVRRVTKRIVRGVTVDESPEWLKSRLASVGQRSINNIVDATNYVMWELGNPVHAFDLSKISDGHIDIRYAHEGEKITALDGIEYTLSNNHPVIADAKGALDIAGIKGGSHSAVDDTTHDLMLSVCSFTPSLIRKASRELNLRTDASKRFENDVPPATLGIALDRLTSLILEVAGGVVEQTLDEWHGNTVAEPIILKIKDVERILGVKIHKDRIDYHLQRIGCTLTWKNEIEDVETTAYATVTTPFWRTDLTLPQHLIEEIGRLEGYDNLPKTPLSSFDRKENDTFFDAARSLRSVLSEIGVSEIFTYSFRKKGSIEVKNKIASDKGFLRDNLSDGMKEAIDLNVRYRDLLSSDTLAFYEVGKVATSEKEEVRFCIGVLPAKGSPQKSLESVIKLIVERLPNLGHILNAMPLNTGIIEFELDPKLVSVSKKSPYTQVHSQRFSPYSTYPYIVRDVAFWTPAEMPDNDIESILGAQAGSHAVRLSRFDRFEKDGRISHGYRIVFQSFEKTLTDDEIAPIMQSLYDALKQKGWDVR